MQRRTFVVTSLGALSCTRAPKPPAVRVRMAISGASQLIYLPAILAGQLGFYREENLDVVLEDCVTGAKALEAVMGNGADVASGFYDQTIAMAAEGRRLTAFVNLVRYPGLVLAVSPKAKKPVTRIDQLAGATAGVTNPGSSTHFLLNYLLTKRNVSPTDVRVTGIGYGSSAISAIEDGAVDVGIITQPAIAEIERRNPRLKILADARTPKDVKELFGAAEYPGSVLYAPSDWIARNKPIAQRLTRALRKTLSWINSHSATQIAGKMPAEHRGPDAKLYESAVVEAVTMFNPNGVLNPEGAAAVQRVLGYSLPAVRAANIDLKTTYTNEFAELR